MRDDNNDDRDTNRTRWTFVVHFDVDEAVTDEGQPLALEERFTTGSKSWGDFEKDKYQYTQQSSFPPCSGARTTLYANDRDHDVINEKKYETLFRLQHGRQHPDGPRVNGYSEGWDGQKVRMENVDKYNRAETVLSRVEIKGSVRHWALKRVMQVNLNGFNRYYGGVEGAALGFATLCKYPDVDRAKGSYLVDEAEEMLDIDGERLVEYVWQKYGGDRQ
jgi:hypothetical protein